jgi:hypothetical protein
MKEEGKEGDKGRKKALEGRKEERVVETKKG